MFSWWSNMEAVAGMNIWVLAAMLVFAVLTGIMVFLSAGKSRNLVEQLNKALGTSKKQIKSLEKAAEEIRKELLETKQHQDINQLQLKTSKSSAEELRQALVNARKRLEIAEAAIEVHQEEIAKKDKNDGKNESIDTGKNESIDTFDPELDPGGGLSENQREHLINLLDPGPKGNVDVFCVLGNEQSELTAKQLEEILTADGWKTNGVAQSAFSNPPKGIVLAVNSKETAPSYASFLQRVFTTIGLAVSAKFESKYREWSLTVIVGIVNS